MTYGRDAQLNVLIEPVGSAPKLWAWAIYRGSDRFLILRSRPEYHEYDAALEAGLKAAADVSRLQARIIVSGDKPGQQKRC